VTARLGTRLDVINLIADASPARRVCVVCRGAAGVGDDWQCEACGSMIHYRCYWLSAPASEREAYDAIDVDWSRVAPQRRNVHPGFRLTPGDLEYVTVCRACRS
jgi:hypothetical protein